MQQISIPSLCNKEPDLFPPVIGLSLRPMRIRCVQCRLPGLNICFFGLDPPRPLEDLPEQIQPAIYRYAHIGRDEVIVIECLCFTGKCVEAIEKRDHGEEAEREPSAVGLEAGFEDKCVAADALSAQSAMKFDVRERDRHPGQSGGDGG